MINLLSESAYVAQTNKIKTAIINKVNAIKASLIRIGEKLGATINWLDDVENTLDDELTAINTELTDKGSTQADDFSEVAEKISDIQTGITPTGQIAITQNGTYDVTNYESASVAVPQDTSAQTALNYDSVINYDSVTVPASDVIEELTINNSRITSLNAAFYRTNITKGVVATLPNCSNFRNTLNYTENCEKFIINDCKVARFDMFSWQLGNLTEFRVPPNIIGSTYTANIFGNNLTDESLVSIGNGLVEGTQTLALSATPKARCDSILGEIDGDGLFVASASGTVTLTQYITQTKGWTIA